jgi:hypothetical protein
MPFQVYGVHTLLCYWDSRALIVEYPRNGKVHQHGRAKKVHSLHYVKGNRQCVYGHQAHKSEINCCCKNIMPIQ